jgi:hypothetical protein
VPPPSQCRQLLQYSRSPPHHQRPHESASQVGRQDAFLSHPCALRDGLEGEKVAHLAQRHLGLVCEAQIRLVLDKLVLDHPEALEVASITRAPLKRTGRQLLDSAQPARIPRQRFVGIGRDGEDLRHRALDDGALDDSVHGRLLRRPELGAGDRLRPVWCGDGTELLHEAKQVF